MTVKTKVKRAAKSVMKAISPSDSAPHDTDLLDTLKHEHDEVKDLLADLEDTQGSAQRRSLVKKIELALVPHTKAEQKVLYEAIIALKDKDAQEDGHEGFIEHDLAAKTLQKLGTIANAASPEHKAAAKVLKELVEHHIDEEESNVWGDARTNFSEDRRKQMNAAYLSAKARVSVT
jgi:hemerythrin-like domain-containing protein